jgi:hypothetical protein
MSRRLRADCVDPETRVATATTAPPEGTGWESAPVLGLDIGGAGLKLAIPGAVARAQRFPLWKQPERLASALVELAGGLAFGRVAVTMTGELCDAFETRAEGVAFIAAAVERAFAGHSTLYWRTDGRFVTVADAIGEPWFTASANWLALASASARFISHGPALLIDVGSTTADLIPIDARPGRDGAPPNTPVTFAPAPIGRTDPERLASGELVYVGAERTPVCALVSRLVVRGVEHEVMNELFATTLDVGLIRGWVAEDPDRRTTADGRSATSPFALDRLARMTGMDRTCFTPADADDVARQVESALFDRLDRAVHVNAGRLDSSSRRPSNGPRPSLESIGGEAFQSLILSGEGEPLIRAWLAARSGSSAAPRRWLALDAAVVSLTERLGPAMSTAACAWAVAELAASEPRVD